MLLPNLPPDWAELDAEKTEKVERARELTLQIVIGNCMEPGDIGFALRGIALAVADQFGAHRSPKTSTEMLQAGLESTVRATQNAFGQRYMDLEAERGDL